jgi:hypothetical protein
LVEYNNMKIRKRSKFMMKSILTVIIAIGMTACGGASGDGTTGGGGTGGGAGGGAATCVTTTYAGATYVDGGGPAACPSAPGSGKWDAYQITKSSNGSVSGNISRACGYANANAAGTPGTQAGFNAGLVGAGETTNSDFYTNSTTCASGSVTVNANSNTVTTVWKQL